MFKAHKVKLYPNKKQEVFFRKSCGIRRFAYNWGLNKWKELYAEGLKPSAYSVHKELTKVKKEQFPWMYDVAKTAPQYAISDLEVAYRKFFKKHGKYPKYKKKGDKDSFIAVQGDENFKQKDKKIWISRIGWVSCSEDLRFKGKVNYVAVKRIADMWFAVINVETKEKPKEIPTRSENQAIVGIDLGVKHLAICSNGDVYDNPMPLKRKMKTMKRQLRSLKRKKDESSNRRKQKNKVGRLHYKISCIRKDALHKATIDIVRKSDVIVIEGFDLLGMYKNHKIAQALKDASLGEFKRIIKYKAGWAGVEVVTASRMFPSSKMCSCCGWIKEDLTLNHRKFNCESCGLSIDRDMNAAINLANYGRTEKTSVSQACGEGSSVVATQHSPSEKQEANNYLQS